jgi:hypothetical protein
MPISEDQLAERMQKRIAHIRHNVSGKIIEAHGCEKTGGGTILVEKSDSTVMAFFFKGRAFKRQWRMEKITSNHERLNIKNRLGKLLAEEKAAKVAPHDLKVGDIIADIWGHTMRDVNFYRVVDVPHPRKVSIARIGEKYVTGDWMSGQKVPDEASEPQGEARTLSVSMLNGYPEIQGSSISSIQRWDGKPVSIYCD